MKEPNMITVRAAHEIAGVSMGTIRRWMRAGVLTKHVTATGRVRVDETELRKAIAATPVGGRS